MKRNPELAHEITKLPDIAQARHLAIDKVTAAHLAVDALNRDSSPVKEIEQEERAVEYMEDAIYYFRKYLRMKLKAYEQRLHDLSDYQSGTIERGNKALMEHSATLDALKQERGL